MINKTKTNLQVSLRTVLVPSCDEFVENEREKTENPHHVYPLCGHHGELPSFYYTLCIAAATVKW